MNPGCPPIQATVEVLVIEVPEAAKEPVEIAAAEDHAATEDHGRL